VISAFQKSKWTKISALTVAVVFLYQQLVWAQGGPVPHSNVSVPYNVGRMTDVYSCPGEEVIIHLQDAHASLSAQYSIANLLDSLGANYDLDLIALEGAEGAIDTSQLKTFPDKVIRKEAADLLNHFRDRRAVAEMGEETTIGPHQIDNRAVVHQIAVVFSRRGLIWHLGEVDPELFGRRGDLLRATSEADQPRMEIGDVDLEMIDRVALRVDRDKNRRDRVTCGTQLA